MVPQMHPEDEVRRQNGDRRVPQRFDIVGELWGTLETVLRLPLKNVGRGGALFESHVPLASRSVHSLAIHSDGQVLRVPVRVSHVDTELSASGVHTYLIGVEFLLAPPALLEVIDRWLAEREGEAAGA